MACAHPRLITPSVSVNGYEYSWKKPITAPCGKCVNCIRDKQNYIIDRANYEFCKRLTASFVTFTYNDIYLIDRCAVRDPSGGFMYDTDSNGNTVVRTSIRYDDLTNFIDSIRVYIKRHPEFHNIMCQPDFTYMYCGEYGSDKYPDLLGRCHFHVIFFGLDFAYCKKIIFERWKYGFIDCRPLLDGGIRYVTKYMSQFEMGDFAEYKYDMKGCARPKLRLSRGFGQGLLFDNIDDIYANYFSYPIEKGKRRPISQYWKSLITGHVTKRDPTKKDWRTPSDEYKCISMLRIAQSMIERNLHHTKNIYSEKHQSEFKQYLAKIREENLITQAHQNLEPVPDLSSCFSHKFGWLTWYGDKVRKLPTNKQRLLADEYQKRLQDRYLYLKFPDYWSEHVKKEKQLQ